MENDSIKQIFYGIGILATLYFVLVYVLPFLFRLAGWILGIVITAIVLAGLITAVLYSISKLAELFRK
jgi:hypothetical protein